MSVDHYENFPVASLLLPAHLRPAVHCIYRFARSADDFADEGDLSDQERLALLQNYLDQLNRIDTTSPTTLADATATPVPELFDQLQKVIRQHQLPVDAFRDLIDAFQQDVVCKRYADFGSLLHYCARSANPVGRIMLQLYQAASPANLAASDAICSALQLINFCQDVAIDMQKQRIYLPLEDLNKFSISPDEIAAACQNGEMPDNWSELMDFECQRARDLMLSGSDLCLRLPGRLGWELRLVVQGGLRVLEKIQAVQGDVFRQRPTLNKTDWLRLCVRAIRM